MYKKDKLSMAISISTKCIKQNPNETTIKINPNLNLPDTSLSKDKRPSKKVSRSKRK